MQEPSSNARRSSRARRSKGTDERPAIGDHRRAPFCWQSLDDLHAIRANVPRQSLTSALAVYLALTELASIREGFVVARKDVAAAAGVSLSTLDRMVEQLHKIGVIPESPTPDEVGQ
jgi:hypothetical protein